MTLITLPCLLLGGTEFQTLNLVKGLKSMGQDVMVLVYFDVADEMLWLFENEGAIVNCLFWNRNILPLRLIIQLSKVFKEIKPDVVHIQYMAPGALPIFAAALARVPRIIATVHQPYTKGHGWKSLWILRIASLFCNPFLSVSQNAARSWFGKTSLIDLSQPITKQAKQLTLYNTIDVKKIQNLIKNPEVIIPQNIDVKQPIIGAVARFSHEKGIDILIQAFSSVQKTHPNTQLLLVGDGPKRQECQTLVKQLKLEQCVFFYGAADWKTAMHLMSLMNIVVVPSRFEGFGLTAAEAMAMGKPVIASDTFGLKELITHGESGLLFENENQTDLANKLLQLLSDINLSEKLSKVGYEKALKNFDYPVFERNIRCLYNL
jgi:glycosyltransferase involved in cell wall biosynthesis